LREALVAVGLMVAATSCGGNVVIAQQSEDGESGTAETNTGTPTEEPNAPPPAPTLASPADGSVDQSLETELCWNPVVDPEGDALRYRVYVNGSELTLGRLGEDGYEGPCTKALTFAFEKTYEWEVRAFEVDDPSQASELSETWSFTVENDGISRIVFEDDFEDDLGWELSGDAEAGEWTRGGPGMTEHLGDIAQVGRCSQGSRCYFTGNNPLGVVDHEDVSGGSTILTSPPFDLGIAETATIVLDRAFYKSEVEGAPALRIELLVPNGDLVDAHELEELSAATADAAENLWRPREYSACGVPMVDGSRLRITAHDAGEGVLEAAIDDVSVRAFDDTAICSPGEGGHCDPLGPACPGELLCCAQGSTNDGIHRCSSQVAGLDHDAPPASPEDPGNGAMGCEAPDLIADASYIEPLFTQIEVDENTCELGEGCLGDVGMRSLLLFTAATPNIGSADLVMGVPANQPDLFHYDSCHEHYHFEEYARYDLHADGVVVAEGHKQAFCMVDLDSWAWPGELPKFDCANQGISRGFIDFYAAGLPCQWVDVTDVPPGDYSLRIRLNQPRPFDRLPLLVESDYDNNTLEFPITVP
jgi:hypothetical protein